METKREWTTIKEYEEILFDFYNGIARITINRERYRNAFTPTTTTEVICMGKVTAATSVKMVWHG